MISIKQIITRLRELGITVYLDNGKLKTRSAPGAINGEVKKLIGENKDRIIEFLTLLADNSEPLEEILPRTSTEESLPLSYAQQRLWLIDRMNGGSAEYNMPIKLRVRGKIDIQLAEQALTSIIQRHQVLRTVYFEKNGQPLQKVLDDFEFRLTVTEVSSDQSQTVESKIEELIHENSHNSFDLNSDLMIRGSFVVLERTEDVIVDGLLLLCIHHIAGDGWSMGILVQEFTNFYQQGISLKTDAKIPSIQYTDYALWQRDWMQSNAYEKQEKYWLQHLKNVPELHNVTLDKERPAVKRYEGAQIETKIDKAVTEKLVAIAKQYRISDFALLHALLSLVFSRHSGTHDVVIGTALANRNRHETSQLIGFFVNTIALRVNTDFDSFAEYLEHVGKVNLNAQSNPDVPFEKVVEKLRLSRSAKYTPLVQLFFTMSTGLENDISVEGLEFDSYAGGDVVSKFDISVSATITNNGLAIDWVYDKSIFSESSVTRLSDHFKNCLKIISQDAAIRVQDIRMLSDKEKNIICYEFNKTSRQMNDNRLIHELFEEQVKNQRESSPELKDSGSSNAALVYKGETTSYQHLNRKANQLARYLRDKGVGVETVVGILLDRTPDTVISMLAILKAGGAYLPLDTEYPAERLSYIIHDSQMSLVISRKKFYSILSKPDDSKVIQTIDLDDRELQSELCELDSNNLAKPNNQSINNLAYIIYTSGSTGKPKGVMVEHRSLVNQNQHEIDEFQLSLSSRIIHLFSFSFDPGTGHLFSGLVAGATVYIEDPRDDLIKIINDNQITHASFPTSVLIVQPRKPLPTLELITVGGEKCTEDTVRFWAKGRKFINLYGPTEATIYCTHSVYQGEDISRCIGTPISNSQCYVLDTNQSLLPIGAPGELYVGGACVARGYLHRKELTDEKFVSNPFSDNQSEKLYRTGDLVKLKPNGQLEFISRIDDQVKFRGFRIELGEIETKLVSHELVHSTAVELLDSQNIEKQLVAYIVPSQKSIQDKVSSELLLKTIKSALQKQLPYYMQPSAYLIIEEIPLTAGGKVDRRALPKPEYLSSEDNVQPNTNEEHQLASIWSKLLKKPLDSICIETSFFELGGHSLLLVGMITEIREVFSVELDFVSLFEAQTITAIAKLIEKTDIKLEETKIVPISRDSDFFPMSFSQQRLWFIDQLNQGSPEYNMPLVLEVNGNFDRKVAEYSINSIIERHESLRTQFNQNEQGPCQILLKSTQFKLGFHDLSNLESASRESRIKELIKEDSEHVFELSKELLIRATFLKLPSSNDKAKGLLVFNMHHIVSDGWSMGVLVKEFVNFYQEISQTGRCNIEPLAIQYADYAYWQRSNISDGVMKQQLQYWEKRLEDAPIVHTLPLDFKRPEIKKNTGGILNFSIEEDLTKELKGYANECGITLFMLLHAAFGLVLSKHSNSKDVIIGTPVANRTHSELESLIGFFLNTLVLRTSTDFKKVDDYIAHVKEINVEAQANQSITFEYLVEHCQVPRTTQYSPLFQILFTMDSTEKVDLEIPGLEFKVVDNETINAKFDLTLNAQLIGGSINFSWTYDNSIFDEIRIENMGRHFNNILREIVSRKDELNKLSMLDEREVEILTNNLNQTKSEYPKEQLIHQLFESQVQKTPQAIALIDCEQKLTYEEYNISANQLANYLIQLGVEPGEFVGLYVERSINMMIGIMGIIKAGGVYVPLDPAHGSQRLEYSIEDTSMKVLVTQSRYVDAELNTLVSETKLNNIGKNSNLNHVICLDSKSYQDAVNYVDKSNPNLNQVVEKATPLSETAKVTSQNLVYLIYTSGSTGQPKGVEITHQGLVDYCYWGIHNYYPSNLAGARIISSVSFDGTVTSLYFPLLVGGYVELLQPETALDVFWDDLIETTEPLMIKITPSHIQGLMVNENMTISCCQHTFVIGGELLTHKVLNRLRAVFPDAYYFHHYGPTEAVVGCTLLDLNDYPTNESNSNQNSDVQQGIPIGKPMGNVNIYITDSHLNLLPYGTPGELCIGGDGLARGYLNHPILTKEKFIKNPFVTDNSSRIYRTGDLVNYTKDGNINFIGRLDGQVKVRGFRIELGEIEQKLLRQDEIKSAVVITHKDHLEQNRLVAYIVSEIQHSDDKQFIEEIKANLQKGLPDYMVPSLFILVSDINLTSSGKVDKKSLPKPDFSQIIDVYEAPTSKVERVLVNIWAELLRIPAEKLSVIANFFELGGDSILSIQVASRANKLGYHFTTKDVFTNQTIRELSNLVTKQSTSAVNQDAVTGKINLLPIQQRFLGGDKALHHFNQAVLLKTPQNFEFSSLEAIVEAIYLRHDALRLRFKRKAGEWQAFHQPYSKSMLTDSLLSHTLDEDGFSDLPTIADKVQASFDLLNGPLVKVVHFVNNRKENRILLVLHHLIVDGVSWRILLEDLTQLYNQIQTQKSNSQKLFLPPKTNSYQEWSDFLLSYASSSKLENEKDYWIEALSVTSATVKSDRASESSKLIDSNEDFQYKRCEFNLSKELTKELLHKANKPYRTRINELLMAGLLLGLNRYQGTQSIRIDLENHGRQPLDSDIDLSQTVGWFTTIYPLFLSSNVDEISQLICNVKEQCRRIPDNGIGFGILKYIKKDQEIIKLSESNSADILFNYLGQFDQVTNKEELFSPASEPAGKTISQEYKFTHSLNLSGIITEGELCFSLNYFHTIFSDKDMNEFMQSFKVALVQVIEHCLTCEGLFTPADFPLLASQGEAKVNQESLTQNQLNTWQKEYEISDIYPATGMQEGLLFHSELEAGSYVNQMQLTFDHGINLEHLRIAWQQLVNRHDIFRTAFVTSESGKMLQLVQKSAEIDWRVINLEHLNLDSQKEEISRLRKNDKQAGFIASNAPLMRVTIFVLGRDKYQMLWSHHHALTDGWSNPIIFSELIEVYHGLQMGTQAQLPQAPLYRDYANWLNQQNTQEAESFWKEKVIEIEDIGTLPAFESLDPGDDNQGIFEQHIQLTKDQSSQLVSLAKSSKTTVNVIVQAAWALLLSRYSDQTKIVFGATTSGRPSDLPGVEKMVGLFINTVPVIIDVDENLSVKKWLRIIHEQLIERETYNYFPLFNIHRLSPNRKNLFDSLLAFENYPVDEAIGGQANEAELDIGNIENFEGTDYGITLTAFMSGTLSIKLDIQKKLLSALSAKKLAEHLQQIILNISASSEMRICDVSMLTNSDLNSQVNSMNQTEAYFPKDKAIHELFEAQVELNPEQLAVIYNDQHLTYHELNIHSNQLAHYLRERGVGPDVLVGICAKPSLEMMIAVIGILKAGGAYLPLDPNYPKSRLIHQLEDSQVKHLLTQNELVTDVEKLIEKQDAIELIALDGQEYLTESSSYPKSNPEITGDKHANNLAYVIYTSGSTGMPKGVLIEHSGAVNYLYYAKNNYFLEELASSIVSSSLSFDATLTTLMVPLIAGKRIEILNDDDLASLQQKLLFSDESYLFKLTPAHLTALSLLTDSAVSSDLSHVIVIGGEQLNLGDLQVWKGNHLKNSTFINEYGPTETVVGCSQLTITKNQELRDLTSKAIPIGKAINNTSLFVLDRNARLLPYGVAGELYIGGEGVARGYLNQPELTQSKFIQNPFSNENNNKLYRTGDVVRYLSDGNLEFIGRVDEQVKIRGFRIEIGEIESQLLRCKNVHSALVIAKEDNSNGMHLIAYVITNADHEVEQTDFVNELRQQLAEHLPDYMLPSAFILLDAFPLTQNGKIDKQSLPAPDYRSTSAKFTPPENSIEEALVAIWGNIFNIDSSSINVLANFFEIGGHSLSAMRLKSEINKKLGLDISLKNIFLHSSVRAQANYLMNSKSNKQPIHIIPVERRKEGMPLSYSQQRLWFIHQLGNTGSQYNMPNALRFEGNLDIKLANLAIKKVIERHEILRTSFVEKDGEAVQVINQSTQFELQSYDISNLNQKEQETKLQKLIDDNKSHVFELDSGCLIRAVYILMGSHDSEQNSKHSGALIFNLHHIISDGWSMKILVDEFVNCYQAIVSNNHDNLQPIVLQYADYAHWQRQHLNEEKLSKNLDYWESYLDGAPSSHSLPLDRPRTTGSRKSGLVTKVLSIDLVKQISQVVKQHECTLFMLFQSLLAVNIGRMTHETDVVIGSPNAGRESKEYENLIGLFLNTQIFRTRFSNDTTLISLLAQSRESYLESLPFNDAPFEAVVDRVKPPRSLKHTPIFQVLINFNNVGVSDASFEDISFSPIISKEPENKFDITLYVNQDDSSSENPITLSWVYDANIFNQDTLVSIANEFEHLLTHAVNTPEKKLIEHSWRASSELSSVAVPQYDLPGSNLVEMFEYWASVTPNSTALTVSGESWSYDQLNREVNQLSNALVQRLGIKTNDRIAIALSRSHLRIKAILATLKLGACYIPLSEELPIERLTFMVEDSQASVILSDRETISSHDWLNAISTETSQIGTHSSQPSSPVCLTVDEENFQQSILQQPDCNPSMEISSNAIAHIIYTSGSTGQPKGVLGTYGATFNRVAWMLKQFPFESDQSMAHITSMAFIRGVWELFVPICGGARMVLIDRRIVRQTDRLWETLNKENINRLVTAPSLMRAVSEMSSVNSSETTIKDWFVSGEPLLQIDAHNIINKLPGINVYNLYGSTEVMSDVLWHKVDVNDQRINTPVGLSIDGVGIAIVDRKQQVVPNGVIGEILVYGEAVANGYTRTMPKEDNAFTETNLGAAYRTGDLGRVTVNNVIECLGRMDDQIKIRGYRVEPAEILYHMLQHTSVESCQIVVANTLENGNHLLAYFVPSSDHKLNNEQNSSSKLILDLKQYLAQRLPSYMMPSAFIEIAEWPLRPNGKVDKNRLPKPDGRLFDKEFVAPKTNYEKLVISIWSELLALDKSKISIGTSFFEIGGHSLLIVRMVALIEKSTEIRLSVAEVMQRHTAKEIAELLEHYHSNKVLRESIDKQSSDEVERIKI